MAKQQTLDGDSPPKDHLQAEPKERANGVASSVLPAQGALLWYCGDCGARVTLSPDLEREYGHNGWCDYRIYWRRGAGIR